MIEKTNTNEVLYPGRLAAYRMVRNFICAQKAFMTMDECEWGIDDRNEAWYAFKEMLKVLSESKERITQK